MTLGEENPMIVKMEQMYSFEAGEALRKVLLDAKRDNRITCGVYQVATMLDLHPERVLLCIHADHDMEDVALDMHFTLMEAFCWENNIKLIKVSNQEKLYSLLKDMKMQAFVDSEEEEEEVPEEECYPSRPCGYVTSEDLVCVLIEAPKEKCASLDTLLEHHHHLSQFTPFPQINLAT